MEIISKFNQGLRFLFCDLDICSKYAQIVTLKDKKRITIIYAFQKILEEFNFKRNKIWVDKDRLYDKSIKSWLEKNDIEMYSTHNEGTYVIAERFIRTLKNKIYKYTTSISKNVYIDKLGDIVNEWNNTYHCTIKMKPVNVKSNTYFDSSKEIQPLVNNNNPKL